jgi:hypothetical protein
MIEEGFCEKPTDFFSATFVRSYIKKTLKIKKISEMAVTLIGWFHVD